MFYVIPVIYYLCRPTCSYLSGLTSAALLSKAGMKVLVLERHGKCGGACHVFKAEGYEFDVGIHYVGDFTKPSLNKTLLEQVSDGQIQWAQMGIKIRYIFQLSLPVNCSISYLYPPKDNIYDRVIADAMSPTQREYLIPSGQDAWKNQLIQTFPEEKQNIETFFSMVRKATSQGKSWWVIVKLLPLWVVNLVIWLGLPRLLSNFYYLGSRTLKDVVDVSFHHFHSWYSF